MRIIIVGYAAFLAAGRGPAPALAAPMVEHFSNADVDAYVEAAVRTLGDSESTTADRDYAVRLLGVLDNPSVASGYKSSACAAAAVGLLSGDLEQIHHGISLAKGVGGCTGVKTSTAREEVAAAMTVRRGERRGRDVGMVGRMGCFGVWVGVVVVVVVVVTVMVGVGDVAFFGGGLDAAAAAAAAAAAFGARD